MFLLLQFLLWASYYLSFYWFFLYRVTKRSKINSGRKQLAFIQKLSDSAAPMQPIIAIGLPLIWNWEGTAILWKFTGSGNALFMFDDIFCLVFSAFFKLKQILLQLSILIERWLLFQWSTSYTTTCCFLVLVLGPTNFLYLSNYLPINIILMWIPMICGLGCRRVGIGCGCISKSWTCQTWEWRICRYECKFGYGDDDALNIV